MAELTPAQCRAGRALLAPKGRDELRVAAKRLSRLAKRILSPRTPGSAHFDVYGVGRDTEIQFAADLDAILSLLPETGQAEGWRSIESAPKDGTPIIAANHAERLSAEDAEIAGAALSEWAHAHLSQGYGVSLTVREVARLIAGVKAACAQPGRLVPAKPAKIPTSCETEPVRQSGLPSAEQGDRSANTSADVPVGAAGGSVSTSSNAVEDKARLDWLETKTVNVRDPLVHGLLNLFWASPDDPFEGEERPSDIRAKIDAYRLAPAQSAIEADGTQGEEDVIDVDAEDRRSMSLEALMEAADSWPATVAGEKIVSLKALMAPDEDDEDKDCGRKEAS